MGLFSKLFGSPKPIEFPDSSKDMSFLVRIADIISQGDKRTVTPIADFVNNTEEAAPRMRKFFRSRWETDVNNSTKEKLCLMTFVTELDQGGYLQYTDKKCDYEDFLFAIETAKAYKKIDADIGAMALPTSKNVSDWCRLVNEYVNGTAYLCSVYIGTDDLFFIWLTPDEFNEVQRLCEGTGLSIGYAHLY